jgi:putative membrane protein
VDLPLLPTVNALLNALAAVLLLRGRALVRRGRVDAHRRTMLAAFATSTLFLVLYVAHKVSSGFESTTFHVEGAARVAYLALLFSHVVLAMAVPPLAITLIRRGLRGDFERHRRLARVAWPIWIYVSATGVLIYALLYLWAPASA